MDAMIDLETMGTRKDCVVLTLGAVKFNPNLLQEPVDQMYYRLDVDQQMSLGRTVDQSTMDWWAQQGEEVRNEAFADDDRHELNSVLDHLSRFLVGVNQIWAHGPVFDICILEHMMEQLNRPCPWNYYQIADSRTLFKLFPEDPRPQDRVQLHNSLADAYYQAKGVQNAKVALKRFFAQL